MSGILSCLRDWFSRDPPLANVRDRYTGATPEEALARFEQACSDENFQNVAVTQLAGRGEGLLARYEVRWKYSVLDDGPHAAHECWALLAAADPAAGDPAGHRFRVAKASPEHHVDGAFA